MKKFFTDFKAFIAKGNVMDMAVAVIIGGAFGKIVTSLVNDIIMPVIGLITGGVSVADLKYVVTPASLAEDGTEIAEVAVKYGAFIQNIVDFLIVAFTIFVVLRIFLAGKKKFEKKQEEVAEEAAPAETELDVLKEIRDNLLKDKQ